MRALTALAAVGAVFLTQVDPAPARSFRLTKVGTFAEPVYVTGVPGRPHTLAVVQRYGKVRLIRRGRTLRRPLLDLTRRVRIDDPRETVDQRGLLSIAFAPDYRRSGRLYLDYVDRRGRLRVDEWHRRTGRLRQVLDLGRATTQHHGGQLQFGPDGLLYVSTGMGDDPESSQDPARPGGKILRLDPRRPSRAVEVVALGLRNPWRFSFDRPTGSMLIGDVGDRRREEVDTIPAGAPLGTNFGWPLFEGTRRLLDGGPPELRGPSLQHTHRAGWCSLVGGYVSRARRPRAIRGRYVYGDVCSGRLWSARLQSGAPTRPRPTGVTVPYLVSFGEDRHGRIYAVSLDGPVFRLGR